MEAVTAVEDAMTTGSGGCVAPDAGEMVGWWGEEAAGCWRE
jgi:hypothetical protein